MKSEEGVQVIACSRDTWSLSGEEILGAEGVDGAAEVCHQFRLGPQNKDEHLTLIFMASSADGLLR